MADDQPEMELAEAVPNDHGGHCDDWIAVVMSRAAWFMSLWTTLLGTGPFAAVTWSHSVP
jgi:hypothetical protein